MTPRPDPLYDSMEIMVVYYLHGKTGQFTVWADGKKISGPINFILELCLPFAQISSFYQKMVAKS